MVQIDGIEQGHGAWVVVRANSAGVHYGRLFRRDGDEVILTATKRVWSWEGANTLHELASVGPKTGNISTELPWNLILGVIEILPLAESARKKLDNIGWTRSR